MNVTFPSISVFFKNHCFEEVHIFINEWRLHTFCICDTMKGEFPYKIKFYASAKWLGKLNTTFWDGCIHKGTIQRLNNGSEEGRFSHQCISAQNIFLQTKSSETETTRYDFVEPGVLIDSYCHVILLNNGFNFLLLFPMVKSLIRRKPKKTTKEEFSILPTEWVILQWETWTERSTWVQPNTCHSAYWRLYRKGHFFLTFSVFIFPWIYIFPKAATSRGKMLSNLSLPAALLTLLYSIF